MQGESTISKAQCPKGHDVRQHPNGGYQCAQCSQFYTTEEIKWVTIDRSGMVPDPYYKPTRYGRID